jgi:hypothetical protein
MAKVAYTIKGAAKATSLEEQAITEAVCNEELIARTVVVGSLVAVIISHADLTAWVQALSGYRV